jgi:hypothetical protein
MHLPQLLGCHSPTPTPSRRRSSALCRRQQPGWKVDASLYFGQGSPPLGRNAAGTRVVVPRDAPLLGGCSGSVGPPHASPRTDQRPRNLACSTLVLCRTRDRCTPRARTRGNGTAERLRVPPPTCPHTLVWTACGEVGIKGGRIAPTGSRNAEGPGGEWNQSRAFALSSVTIQHSRGLGINRRRQDRSAAARALSLTSAAYRKPSASRALPNVESVAALLAKPSSGELIHQHDSLHLRHHVREGDYFRRARQD